MAAGIGQQADPAVGSRHWLAAAVEQARIARRSGRTDEGKAAHVLCQHEGSHGLEHRQLDVLAFVAAFAVHEGRHHGIGQRQPADLVGDQAGHVGGRLAVDGAQAHQAAGGLDDVVEGRAVAPGAVLAEAGGYAVDDLRVEGRHCLVAEAQSLYCGDAHVVHDHVRTRDQRAQRVGIVFPLEVEHHRSLVAVQRQVDRAHARV
ncbi:hypothetical protein D9M69_505020 [compost metagenome]